MANKRYRFADRRKASGYSQESLAVHLGVDRSTVVRWEGGCTEPQPHLRPKLAKLLSVTLSELDGLLASPEAAGQTPSVVTSPSRLAVASAHVTQRDDFNVDELDDMKRRELLRALSVAGTFVALPPRDGDLPDPGEAGNLDELELLNARLWQVFMLSRSKRAVYPLVRQQIEVLTADLERPCSMKERRRLCALTGDLFQLAGEIFFDGNRYTDAAYCYTLAASAGKEANSYDLWACALVRHAFIGMYERRFAEVSQMLSFASRVAQNGDSRLSVRYWVAAVQAQVFAGIGDVKGCERALGLAGEVSALDGEAHNGGWLRFDGSRLAEERGACYVELGRSHLADAALTSALGQKLSVRRQGGVLVDLALLGIQRRDYEQVIEYGNKALDLARQTGSGYIGRRLRGLHENLPSILADSRILELKDCVAALACDAVWREEN